MKTEYECTQSKTISVNVLRKWSSEYVCRKWNSEYWSTQKVKQREWVYSESEQGIWMHSVKEWIWMYSENETVSMYVLWWYSAYECTQKVKWWVLVYILWSKMVSMSVFRMWNSEYECTQKVKLSMSLINQLIDRFTGWILQFMSY